ncbi:MAG: hypothetical protein ACK47C_06475 [Paracoccaceae bacterium]
MQGGIDKSHLSGIENARRAGLNPITVSRLVAALDLDKRWIDCFKSGAAIPVTVVPPTAEETRQREETAERLEAKALKDPSVPPIAESLLKTLAFEFAGGDYLDLHTTYTALRQALEAAENIRKRGEMPPDNTGSQLNAVMAEVAKLNNQGALEKADALLDAEEARMRETQRAERDRMEQQAQALLTQRIDQDRLRIRPDLAAERILRHLLDFPKGKLFWKVNAKADEWRDEGDKAGDMFALQVALVLSKGNYARVRNKKPLAASALHTVGWCYLRLAERSSDDQQLKLAWQAFDAAVKMTSKSKDPVNWSAHQDGLGAALGQMGERQKDSTLLTQAVAAHRAALRVGEKTKSTGIKVGWNNLGDSLRTLGELTEDEDKLREAEGALTTALALENKSIDPLAWEATQSNLALAQRWLGAIARDAAKLKVARIGYAACEDLGFGPDAPFAWAVLQWNIADLALARYRLDPDPALIVEAREYVGRARAFFVEGSEYQTERCDELIAEIDAAEVGV